MDFRKVLLEALPAFIPEVIDTIVDYHGIPDEAIQELIKVLQQRGQEIQEEGTYEVKEWAH